MESEVIQALQTIADNIQVASQPGLIEYLSIGISLVSVVVSGVAIWFAIRVPKEIAVRQIKVQTYEYKMGYLKTCYKLRDEMQALKSLFQCIDLTEDSFGEAYERYSQLNIQRTEIIMALLHSKSVFTEKSWNMLDKIREEFRVIDNTYGIFNLYSSVLTQEEQREKELERVRGLAVIKARLSEITKDLMSLIEILENDITISDIHRIC